MGDKENPEPRPPASPAPAAIQPAPAPPVPAATTAATPMFVRADDPGTFYAVATMTVNLDDQVALGELILHYTNLLSRGYRATRWEHPRFGVQEQLPSGDWKFSAYHPNGRKK